MVTARKRYGFDPDYAIPPGETLKEVMDSLDMAQKELAVRTGLTEQSLNRIFNGRQPITFETANKLELATGVPASMWNSLEARYGEQRAKAEERERLSGDLKWLREIPTSELVARGAIRPHEDQVLLLRETLQFYGVSSVEAWREMWESPKVAARRSSCFESRPGPASAWIRLGEIQAHQIDCRQFDAGCFRTAVQAIRSLTVKSPQEFVPAMRRLCAQAGVALALVREMQKVPWKGATKWITAAKAMILLNLRGKGEDQFWFSFFHEAGHVLNDSRDNKKHLFINDGSDDRRERRADEFAEEILIPKQNRQGVPRLRSRAEVIAFASKIGVSSGIVVGQFQHMTRKWTWFNDLKRKFRWAEDAEPIPQP